MNNDTQKFLSIVIPYYNREHIIDRLFIELEAYDKDDIELIFIDDGSTDGTFEGLQIFNEYTNATIKIYKQENKGPGGARNLGFQNATGKFVWFVDSDDKISVEAYNTLRENEQKEFDFINFNLIRYESKEYNYIKLKPETYEVDDNLRIQLLKNFGALYTKIFRKNFLDSIGFAYPENCINEDYYLYFILPFYFKKFIKTDVISYIYHDDTESITRHKEFNNKLFGRQLSAYNGIIEARKYVSSQEEVNVIFNKYEHLFLYSALFIFYSSDIEGVKRIHLLKKIMNNEYKSLQELYFPYKLTSNPSIQNTKSKILNGILNMVPNNNVTMKNIYNINNSEWKNPVVYPFK